MTITWTTFAVRLLVGFFLAVGIGIERQWLKTRAVLKTNVLVTLGSAMFVMLSIMTPGDASPTRISAQIVSGVGFLGGGVILREGASVRGINTAATLWCAAAIGTLVGSGFLVQAYVSTVIVVGANLLLRPLVEAFKQQRGEDIIRSLSTNDEAAKLPTAKPEPALTAASPSHQYNCYVICPAESEAQVLKLIINFVTEKQLILTGIQSNSVEKSDSIEVEIKASFSVPSKLTKVENPAEIIRIIKGETNAKLVSWQLTSVNLFNSPSN